MQSKASTVAEYIKGLPEDRRAAITAVRDVILKNIDPDFRESMAYGMIGYNVPHDIYPAGYHCDPKQPLPFAGLASQKNYMSLYLCSAYNDPAFDVWLRAEFEKAGKKLDMGKCCVRFKRLDDLPLNVIAKAFQKVTVVDFIAGYEKSIGQHRAKRTSESSTKSANKSNPARKALKSKSNVATSNATSKPSESAKSKVASVPKRSPSTRKATTPQPTRKVAATKKKKAP